MADTTPPMPAWPKRDSYRNSNHYLTRIAEICYERAMKEAYAARLKVAVDMLKLIVQVDRGSLPHTVLEMERKLDKIKAAGERARIALDAIGPIPESEGERRE